MEAAACWLLAAFAAILFWRAVRWALHPGYVLWADEIGNLTGFVDGPLRKLLTVLPHWIYNDRPVGFVFEQVLYRTYGFDYSRQIPWFLGVHLANGLMLVALFRRLGVSLPLGIAAFGVFASLWTSVETATYLGASFDVLCLFFLLASMLTLLWKSRWGIPVSTLLFFLALRTKEFAIVAPALLTLLVAIGAGRLNWRRLLAAVRERVWPHYLLMAVFAVQYASYLPRMRAEVPAGDSYYLQPNIGTVLDSLGYYTALVFGLADRTRLPILLALGAALGYALVRRSTALLFGISAYVLLLLPVAMMPNRRISLYVYAPQAFLILVICLLIEEIPAAVRGWERAHRVFEIAAALAVLLWCAAFQHSHYVKDRLGFAVSIRHSTARTARDAAHGLSGLGPGAHVYLNHGRETPWLFTAGPCDFLYLMNRRRAVCIWQTPDAELRPLYDRDRAEKYYVDYLPDGSLKVVSSSAAVR